MTDRDSSFVDGQAIDRPKDAPVWYIWNAVWLLPAAAFGALFWYNAISTLVRLITGLID